MSNKLMTKKRSGEQQIHLLRSLPFDTGRVVRVTSQQVVDAYRETGSVWAAGKRLGISGQGVWERLRALDYPMAGRNWSDDELTELRNLAGQCTIGEIATRLGRPYAGVAGKISELGIGQRYGNYGRRKRVSGYAKARVQKLINLLEPYPGSLKQFCRDHQLDIETFVHAIQRVDEDFWTNYTKRRSDLTSKQCPNCGTTFYPLTKKQQTCSRRCSDHSRRDKAYFGGNRNKTIGLAEGVCQLCMESRDRLSSHHMLGKDNDPDNEYLIALCTGCHHIVGMLAGRRFVDSAQGWENLINLVLARRLADKKAQDKTDYVGTHACVDVEWLTSNDLETMYPEAV